MKNARHACATILAIACLTRLLSLPVVERTFSSITIDSEPETRRQFGGTILMVSDQNPFLKTGIWKLNGFRAPRRIEPGWDPLVSGAD